MQILIAADKFKDSLTALEVVGAMGKGLLSAFPEARIDAFPMADGGEGSLDVWLALEGGDVVELEVMDPLFRPVPAGFGISKDGKTAFVEMARASGLERLRPGERDCWNASTVGTGQLIRHALDLGVEKIIIAAGGSASTDGGTGMAEALGIHFLDQYGWLVPVSGGCLSAIRTIDARKAHPRLQTVDFEVWTDVNNALCGPQGSAYTFSRQKGAREDQIPLLDEGLRHFAGICEAQTGKAPVNTPGAAAGGGLAFGAAVFMNARLLPGAEQFLAYPLLSEAFARADFVITGEGRLDSQTRFGKTVQGVCAKAKERHTPVVALCGAVEAGAQELADMGLLAAFSVLRQPGSLPEALLRAREDLEAAAWNLGRVLRYYEVTP